MDTTVIIRILYKRRISDPAKLLLASQEGTLIHLGADVLLTVACKSVTLNAVRKGKPYHMHSNITRIILPLSFFYSIYFENECVTRIDNFTVGFGLH